MAFTVQDFRSQLQYDGARPNLFQCRMDFPTVSENNIDNLNSARNFTFMARAAQLPGSTVNSVSQFYFGRELKFAGNRQFPEWTVTIINDEDFILRDKFEQWMNGINSHVGNLRDPNFINTSGYQADGYVSQFAKTGGLPIKEYKFVGMFPIDISPIELDWGSNDTIEEYAVTFAYQWWEWNAGKNGPTTDRSDYNL